MSQTPIDTLQAPDADGDLLIWPDGTPLKALALQNRTLRGSYRLNLPGQAPATISPKGDDFIIATGHQPGFLHPGVWIKNVAACAVARQLSGQARFLVVDNDALQHAALQWPQDHDGYLRLRSVLPFKSPLDWPYELLPETSSSQWSEFFANLPAGMRKNQDSAMPVFLDAFLVERSLQDQHYLARWTRGMTAMEGKLTNFSPEYVPVSSYFDPRTGSNAARFFAHISIHASDFATAYNSALAGYRKRRGIHSRQHPIPDLSMDCATIELPFWALSPDRPRQRLSGELQDDVITLKAGAEAIARLSRGALERDPLGHLAAMLVNWRIRPRALTLTMFTRLLECDLFIHGIGGAKYDQITDDCIRSFFGVEPPAYACVSATLRLGLPRFDADNDDLIQLVQEQRDMRFNPQRFISPTATRGIAGVLHDRQAAIGLSTQLRSQDPANRPARKSAYDTIQRSNLTLRESIHSDDTCCIEELKSRLAHNRVADYREWFMGFHPTDKLKGLADNLITRLDSEPST